MDGHVVECDDGEDPLHARIFPPSAKLDAYGIAFDDLAVFEAAGHSRESTGKLATYGFVTYRGMRTLLESAAGGLQKARGGSESTLAEMLPGARFLDLGSGDGRAVIGAAILAPTLAESVGVELSVARHDLAAKNREHLPESLREVVRFEQADIFQLEHDRLASADIVWVSNLRFPDDLVEELNNLLEKACAQKRDAVVATLRECPFKRPHSAWTEQVSMSWNPDGWPVFCYHLPALVAGNTAD